MFVALARLAFQRHWSILGATLLLLAGAVAALVRGGKLTTGTIEGTEADRAQQLVEKVAGLSGDSVLAVILRSARLGVGEPPFVSELQRLTDATRALPSVDAVTSPLEAPPALAVHLISTDGHAALLLVRLRGDLRAAVQAYPEVRSALASSVLEITITGKPAFLRNLDLLLERDLLRAELISFPLALIVLLMVFRTAVAALMPLLVGGLAVMTGVAGVMLLSHVTNMAQYTLNVVSLIGLGVAIDYSLFIVTRFRSELGSGASLQLALERTFDTAGRAVAFSGLAVGVGLAGLFFYRSSYLSAMGLAGAIVVGSAVLFALTFLPALLSLLGERIERGRIPLPTLADRPGVWHALSTWVMRRPVMVLIPSLALVVLMGSPFLRLEMAATDINVLPKWSEARKGADLLAQLFPLQAASRIVVAVEFPSAPAFTPERARALHDLSRRLAKLPGVIGVESIVDLDPRMDREAYAQLASTPATMLPPEFEMAAANFLSGNVALLNVLTRAAPSSSIARELVREIRQFRTVGDGKLWVGGQTANDVDALEYIRAHTPLALGFVMAMTAVVLFLLLGSVVLPLKALLMNLLSIAGSFGALVWIFQEGHLRHLLRFEPGPIEPSLPVLLFCTVFGLSMDYEVLLLSRIQEEYLRSRDNTHSVAEGLEKTAGLITSAAAIMVAVFAAFSLATVVVVKAMGLGMALAVALDATLVRVLIVPATMRLFGDLNWWAPAPLSRWYAARRGGRPLIH